MCGGPSKAERAAASRAQKEQAALALEQRIAAEAAAQAEATKLAQKKQQNILEALDARTVQEGMSGGSGRRSLISGSGGGQGFLGRFS